MEVRADLAGRVEAVQAGRAEVDEDAGADGAHAEGRRGRAEAEAGRVEEGRPTLLICFLPSRSFTNYKAPLVLLLLSHRSCCSSKFVCFSLGRENTNQIQENAFLYIGKGARRVSIEPGNPVEQFQHCISPPNHSYLMLRIDKMILAM